jgi:hypothetical protein
MDAYGLYVRQRLNTAHPRSRKLIAINPGYCPDGAAAVFSGTGAVFPGAVASSLVRNGKNGVTSKGIFSAAVVMAMGLVLISSS